MGRKRGITREKAVLEKLYRDLTGHKCNEGYLYDYKQYGMGYRHWNFCRSAWLGQVSGLSGYEEGLSPELKAEYDKVSKEAIQLQNSLYQTIGRINELRNEVKTFLESKGVKREDIHKEFVIREDDKYEEKYAALEADILKIKAELKTVPKKKTPENVAKREELNQQLQVLITAQSELK